jgi:outer membrane receptor protein involved in Fe transport
VGSDDLVEGGIAVGGPVSILSDDWQLRFSASQSSSNGFRYNQYLNSDTTNQRDEFTTRMKLRYHPSETLTVDISGFVVDNDNGYDLFTIDNSLETESDRPGRDALNLKAGVLKITVKPSSSWRVTSITSRYISNQEYSFDGDWGNNEFWEPFAPYDYFEANARSRSVVAQELRAISNNDRYVHGVHWQWLLGGFGQRFTELASINQSADGAVYKSLDSNYQADTRAVFGELEIPIEVGTSLSVGGRYEYRDADYQDSDRSVFNPQNDMWGGALSLNHDISQETRLYALVARGFKGGGVNPGARVPESRKLYDPEIQWNFELGLKGDWLRGDVTTNITVFQTLRRQSQLKLALQDDPSDPLAFTYLTESQGRGESTGLEIEGQYRINSWLVGEVSGAALFSQYTAVPFGIDELRQREFSYAPRLSYSVGCRARLSDQFFLKGDLSGKDAFYFDDSHNQQSNPYSLLNLTLGYRHGNWLWTVWGRNVLDEKYATRGFFFGNEPPDFPNKLYIQRGDPAQVGTTISYSF